MRRLPIQHFARHGTRSGLRRSLNASSDRLEQERRRRSRMARSIGAVPVRRTGNVDQLGERRRQHRRQPLLDDDIVTSCSKPMAGGRSSRLCGGMSRTAALAHGASSHLSLRFGGQHQDSNAMCSIASPRGDGIAQRRSRQGVDAATLQPAWVMIALAAEIRRWPSNASARSASTANLQALAKHIGPADEKPQFRGPQRRQADAGARPSHVRPSHHRSRAPRPARAAERQDHRVGCDRRDAPLRRHRTGRRPARPNRPNDDAA